MAKLSNNTRVSPWANTVDIIDINPNKHIDKSRDIFFFFFANVKCVCVFDDDSSQFILSKPAIGFFFYLVGIIWYNSFVTCLTFSVLIGNLVRLFVYATKFKI